jgi:hypothetical protein
MIPGRPNKAKPEHRRDDVAHQPLRHGLDRAAHGLWLSFPVVQRQAASMCTASRAALDVVAHQCSSYRAGAHTRCILLDERNRQHGFPAPRIAQRAQPRRERHCRAPALRISGDHSERASHDQLSRAGAFSARHQHGKYAGEPVQPVDRMADQLAQRAWKAEKPLQRQSNKGNGECGGQGKHGGLLLQTMLCTCLAKAVTGCIRNMCGPCRR